MVFMSGPARINNSSDDNNMRRQPGQGPARADQARKARQAEALRANLRKRKAQAKEQAKSQPDDAK
jgi:hypothetical protein|tara:strand:+ start:4322 stop:4519 length:198 start_codon:yes stop_codon:yes gene_type:complete